MCPFPPPEPPQPPNRIRQRSNSPSACQKVIRRQPNSGGSSQFQDRKSTRLNSSHGYISYAVFGLKKTTAEPDLTTLAAALQRVVKDPVIATFLGLYVTAALFPHRLSHRGPQRRVILPPTPLEPAA